MRAAQQVGRALFFSLAIIIISFMPVFLLEAQEGRMFRPLAWTKTFAMVFATMLAITLVPALMTLLIRGRKLPPRARQPRVALLHGALRARPAAGAALALDGAARQLRS